MSKAKKRAVIQSDSDDSGSSDIEQELKAQEAKRPKPTPVSTTAHSSSSGSSSGSDDEWTWTTEGKKGGEKEKKKAVAKVGKAAQVGKRMPAGRKMIPVSHSTSGSSHDEEEEEPAGESQGGSSESSTSGSDSSSDESLQFDDGLDEDLVGDEEDRAKLSNMTDVEREQEMYMRYEKRQMQKTRFEIEQKLRRERRAKKKKVREQAERELNRAVRASRRSRLEDSSKSKAMDELKAKRSADKQKREEQQEPAAAATSAKPVMKEPLNAAEVFSSNSEQESSSSSGSESDGADSDDEAGERSGSQDSAPRYISTTEELSKIKLSRFRLEKWVHMPFFKDVAVGCYVRVGIGAHEGRMVYRVCEITDIIETQKVYSLGPTKTNKCLRLRHGQQERSFRMEYVSNSPFSESEFSKWKAELEQRGHSLPTVDFIRKKSKRIEQAKSFQFKEEDIDKIIEEKQKFRKAPTNYAMTKSRLLRKKELAEEAGDSETVAVLNQELSELEEKAEQLDKQRSKGLSAISYINERNRQRNVSRAEEALKAELAVDKNKDDDPFTRRRCKPTLVTLTKDSIDGPGTAPAEQHKSQSQQAGDEKVKPASKTIHPTTPNGQKLALLGGVQATPNASLLSATPVPPASSSDDLFSAHDFDIQIDLPSTPEGTTTVKTLNKSAVASTPRTDEAPKRSLNLADYKKRRGLI